jgi:hypothetical protein
MSPFPHRLTPISYHADDRTKCAQFLCASIPRIMTTSRTVGQWVSGSLDFEDGGKHSPVEFNLDVLEMRVDEKVDVHGRKVTGIREWRGAKMPDGKCTVRFVFYGKPQQLSQHMRHGILRNF